MCAIFGSFDKEKFEESLKEAIKMIEKANSYTKEGSK